jgi:Domain of unknown function (DUF4375)/Ankyrin repeats (3 copies)
MQTPIQQVMAAICDGTIDQVRDLLGKHPETLQEKGRQMFNYAAENNRVDVLELLLAAGVDLAEPDDHESPLSAAAGEGAVEAAQWLLDHGANLNKKPIGHGTAPLHNAVRSGQIEMVEFLLDRGADPDILGGNPLRNSLALARLFSEDDVAELLQARGVSEIVIESEPVDVEAEAFLEQGKGQPADKWFERAWPDVYASVLRIGLDSMSERNQVLFLVGYLTTQLADGGVESVYANPSGEFAPLMPAALEKIGAREASQLIRRINAFFPDGKPAAENEPRWKQMELLPPEVEQLGEKLDGVLAKNRPDGQCVLVSQLYAFYHT